MLGVMRETFDSEGGSMRGDEDFFSVARTIPFVAVVSVSFDEFGHILKNGTFDA